MVAHAGPPHTAATTYNFIWHTPHAFSVPAPLLQNTGVPGFAFVPMPRHLGFMRPLPAWDGISHTFTFMLGYLPSAEVISATAAWVLFRLYLHTCARITPGLPQVAAPHSRFNHCLGFPRVQDLTTDPLFSFAPATLPQFQIFQVHICLPNTPSCPYPTEPHYSLMGPHRFPLLYP